MKCLLLDTERDVKLNGWNEVSDPISFDKGMIPSEHGLFSTSIFGMTVDDRRNRYAYIDLKGVKIISPKAYIALKRLNRNFESLIYGTKRFKIIDGVLTEDPEGDTGMNFLYNNWGKIKFEKNDSQQRNERIDLLTSVKKNVIFLDKFIVIPAFYRDVNIQQSTSGSPRVPEINDKYNNIIRNINLIVASNNFDIMTNALIGKTQQLAVDIYNILKSKVEKKNGYLRRFVMGKSVDYCSRVVITAAVYKSERWQDQPIDFEHSGVPLSFSMAMLTPYMLWWVNNFFKTTFENTKNSFPILLKNGKRVYVKLDSPELVFNNEYIEKIMSRFIHYPSSRFDKIEVPIRKEDKEKYGINYPVYARMSGYSTMSTTMQTDKNLIERPLTWTDVFYMAAIDVSEGKFVKITRFPLLDYLGSMYTKMYIMSTRNTVPMIINDHIYPHYPVIDTEIDGSNLDSYFIDSVKICPVYLKSIGGDHDGDQVTASTIFSLEACEDADRIMNAKTNIISTFGKGIRSLGNEGVQTMYTMTRFH